MSTASFRLPQGPVTLPGIPKGPITPVQQLEALRRVQVQAEQRVKLGVQLFKAAEAQTTQHRIMMEKLKTEQDKFREQMHQDLARSLQTYDQWVGQIDDNLTATLQKLENRIEQLQEQWSGSQDRIQTMIHRSEALLEQSMQLIQTTREKLAHLEIARKAPPAEQRVAEAAPASFKTPIPEPVSKAPPPAPSISDVKLEVAAPSSPIAPMDHNPAADRRIFSVALEKLQGVRGARLQEP